MKQKDIRYQRTDRHILEAFICLLNQKSFEQITVKDLCSQAHISRSTFYLHYLDKYDIIEKQQLLFLAKARTIFDSAVNAGKNHVLLKIITYFHEEGQLMSLLLTKDYPPELKDILKKAMRETVQTSFFPYLLIDTCPVGQERYLLSFLLNAFLGVLQEWTLSGQKESPEEIVQILLSLIKYDFKPITNEPL